MVDFNVIVEQLTENRIPCLVKLEDNGAITIECGSNYPDSLFDKIMNAVNDADVSVCADSWGGTIIKERVIAGGPKRYLRTDRHK